MSRSMRNVLLAAAVSAATSGALAQKQQAQAQKQQTINTYNRALGACMEGRGYTIK